MSKLSACVCQGRRTLAGSRPGRPAAGALVVVGASDEGEFSAPVYRRSNCGEVRPPKV